MPRYETVEIRVDDDTIAAGDLQAIVEPVWWLIDIYHGPAEYKRTSRQFSKPQRFVFAIRWYRAEVDNGGHEQFYSNSTGIVWRDAAKAFAAIGVKKGASIIFDSADRLGGTPSLDRTTRQMELGQYRPEFSDLDDRFYELCKNTDLETAMLDYVRANAAEFYFSGQITRVVLPRVTRRTDQGG